MSNIFFEGEEKLKRHRLSKKVDNSWIESSFGKYSWGDALKNDASFLGISISNFKFIFIKCFILFCIFALFSRTFYLQIVKGEEYKNLAEINRVRIVPIQAERGIIYDRNQKQLVFNVPNFYFAIFPNDLPKDDNVRKSILENIAKIIDVEPSDIEERISMFSSYNFQSVPIKTNLSYEEAVRLELLNNTYPAIRIETGIKREYDVPESMSHILGFLRKINKNDLQNNSNYLSTDDIGKAGIEYEYEKILRGKYGKKQVEVDALGRQRTILAKEDPTPGEDIILTIDIDLQKKAEDILKKHLRANNISRGVIVISDVQNGEILTMVSLPAYDNNIFSGGLSYEDYNILISNKDKPLFNRAIAGEYPSGSTIKPVFAAAALEDGIINEYTSFISSGGIRIDKWFFPDWKTGGHGTTNVKKALAESVNTFFYIIGGGLLDSSLKNFDFEGLGVKKLEEYARRFGLGKKLGIDLPAEANGFLPSKEWKENNKKEMWYIGDTYHFAIGQGDVLVTPLQVNVWTAIFANRGVLYKPHLLKTIFHNDGTVTTENPEILTQNFIDSKNIEIVRQGLREGVVYGSSRSLSVLQKPVAGKTGTAQWGKGKRPHAWFTGFAPYKDPEIAITVLAEEGGDGSGIAVAIAKEILWWYFEI